MALAVHPSRCSVKIKCVTVKNVAFKGWPCHIKQNMKAQYAIQAVSYFSPSCSPPLPFYLNDNESLNQVFHVNLRYVSSMPLHLSQNTPIRTCRLCCLSARDDA